jgi:pilus assembly protein CpaB
MKRRMVLIAAAVALALVGTLAVFAYVHNADKRAVAGTKPASVLIAHKAVPAGTTFGDAMKDGYLTAEKVPASSAPESAISPLDSGVADTAVAATDIPSGQIALHEMFSTTTSSKTGAIAIPKGMIAISVTMASNADVAGFVQPGSQVAIFGTFTVVGADGKPATGVTGTAQYLTDLILPKVLVTATSEAAPTNVQGAKEGSQSSVSTGGSVLVTLAVTQADAQKIILAQQTGQIYFGLLSDSSVVANDGGTTNVIGTFHPTPLLAQ